MAAHGKERSYTSGTNVDKRCRACMDFQTWAKEQKSAHPKGASYKMESHDSRRSDCPLDKDELGRKTWNFLHTMAAYYPDSPTSEQRRDMSNFFTLFSKFYPCAQCAEDLREQLKVSPPVTSSQHELSQWLCRIHNNINVRLGKKVFDCSKVNQRWRDGWLDGSCD